MDKEAWRAAIHGVGNGNPPQYSGLGNAMDRGAWRATVCGVKKSQHGLARKQQKDATKDFTKVEDPMWHK